jgi:8-oxo-dGTP pyrophosphatase MutT (NUDIX family)
MPKVYAIIRGNGDILVGSGGKSGRKRVTRTGLHLPGGTCDRGDTFINAALREVKEETGINLLEQDVIGSFFLILNSTEVYFVVLEVFSVAAEIGKRKIPPITNQYDEPFADLISLSFNECIDNPAFSAEHHTDWFASGLRHARKSKML